MKEALASRPELSAAGARLQGAELSVAIADRAGRPDYGVMTSYSSMFMGAHQWMVGARMTLPVWGGRIDAEQREADALRERQVDEIARLEDRVRTEVAASRARLEEAIRIVGLYEERLLPLAREQLAVARAGFDAGTVSFINVIDAERSLRDAQLGLELARVEVSRREAELDRAVGRLPAASKGGA